MRKWVTSFQQVEDSHVVLFSLKSSDDLFGRYFTFEVEILDDLGPTGMGMSRLVLQTSTGAQRHVAFQA